jgi:hypothetical protein
MPGGSPSANARLALSIAIDVRGCVVVVVVVGWASAAATPMQAGRCRATKDTLTRK